MVTLHARTPCQSPSNDQKFFNALKTFRATTRAPPRCAPYSPLSMSSPKRKQASQQNGAKSRGPATDEGKARSARNATRHGLLSRTIVLDNEDPKDFRRLLDQHVEKFQPNGDIEHQAIEEMAICQWKLRRLRIIETTLMDDHAAENAEGTVDQAVADAYEALNHSLSRLARYESQLSRQYHRAFRHFQELRKLDAVGSFGKNTSPVLPVPPQVVQPSNPHSPASPTARSKTKPETPNSTPIEKSPVPRAATPPKAA